MRNQIRRLPQQLELAFETVGVGVLSHRDECLFAVFHEGLVRFRERDAFGEQLRFPFGGHTLGVRCH